MGGILGGKAKTDNDSNKPLPKEPVVTNNTNAKTVSIPRPNIIITDIYGVITSWDFANELKAYIKNNLKDHLTRKWSDHRLIDIVNKLREQALIDKCSGLEIPLISEKTAAQDIIIDSVVANNLWQMDNKNKSSKTQLDALYEQVWSDAYSSGRLKTHTFKDVKKAFNHWRYHQFVKIYSYASGAISGQKLFLKSSVEGDLTSLFANHIDSSGGYKYDSNKFRVVISALREANPQNILYFTDDPQKARAASEAKMRAIVVLRPGNKHYTEEELKGLLTIDSMETLVFIDDPSNPAPCC